MCVREIRENVLSYLTIWFGKVNRLFAVRFRKVFRLFTVRFGKVLRLLCLQLGLGNCLVCLQLGLRKCLGLVIIFLIFLDLQWGTETLIALPVDFSACDFYIYFGKNIYVEYIKAYGIGVSMGCRSIRSECWLYFLYRWEIVVAGKWFGVGNVRMGSIRYAEVENF